MFFELLRLLRMTYTGWNRNNAMLHAAGIAFYMIFSLAPLMLLFTSLATRLLPSSDVEWQLVIGLEKQAGEPVTTFIREVAVNSYNVQVGGLTTGLSLLLSLYGASLVFMQLQASLNAMWDLLPRNANLTQSLVTSVKTRLVSTLAVLITSVLLVGSLFLSALWTALPEHYLAGQNPVLDRLMQVTRIWSAPLTYTALFILIFKTLPQATIRWRDVLVGALVTAMLFWLGAYVIRLYLVLGLETSIYGAAGSLVVFLLWIYYSAWIILFGAKFTQVYADTYGAPIVPHAAMTFRRISPADESVAREQ
ncbi:MAG: YihY/virulence factor BrkB family protein [Caldilineaceae bacterium]|nr:YihY/virulence factor BrkB family protein [Caldilineaceae bacterium]